jgi:hypothetical protein
MTDDECVAYDEAIRDRGQCLPVWQARSDISAKSDKLASV